VPRTNTTQPVGTRISKGGRNADGGAVKASPMVYSSRSGCAGRGGAPFEVSAARLAGDVHRMWRCRRLVLSRPRCSCMSERLTWRSVWKRAEGICGFWGF
jgi:hypothetical protein